MRIPISSSSSPTIPAIRACSRISRNSTKQRFGAIDFAYPPAAVEAEIVAHEAGIDRALAETLVAIGQRTRNLRGHGLDEGASTRMLIQAGRLIAGGIAPEPACQVALVLPITDDEDIRGALTAAIAASV